MFSKNRKCQDFKITYGVNLVPNAPSARLTFLLFHIPMYLFEANRVMVHTDVLSGSILCACKFKLIYIVQCIAYAILVSFI